VFLDYGVTLGPRTLGDKHRNAKSLGLATIFVLTEPLRLLCRDAGSFAVHAANPLCSNGFACGSSPSD
jgi:hypothetical protein